MTLPEQAKGQIATLTPSSTTRSLGMRKNSVADTALRAITRNSHSRQIGSFGDHRRHQDLAAEEIARLHRIERRRRGCSGPPASRGMLGLSMKP